MNPVVLLVSLLGLYCCFAANVQVHGPDMYDEQAVEQLETELGIRAMGDDENDLTDEELFEREIAELYETVDGEERDVRGYIHYKGCTSCKGSKGHPSCPPGPKGQKGQKGQRGWKGPAGVKGDRGWKGPAGPKGATGPKGWRGPAGPKGQKGCKGATGPKGGKGNRGPKGGPCACYRKESAFTGLRTCNACAFKNGDIIRFSKTLTNIGGDFSYQTGVFTCEHPGTYFFTFNARKPKTESTVRVDLEKNNVVQVSIHETDTHKQHGDTGSVSCVLNLKKGDRVYLRLVQGCSLEVAPERPIVFSGFLLYD
ncbi:complement C1q subcomponent subunit B-like [Ptychodera flava]|uniref:complement C1q subcomponent subunit B-like n=1 Tax=Ptychodera flava TaxID=63121 RepID=UPI00396A1E62